MNKQLTAVQRAARAVASGKLGAKLSKKNPHRLQWGMGGTPGKVRAPSMPAKAKDAPPLRTLANLGPTECRWPVGDPLKPGFGFCGRPRQLGKPYCPEHMARAYVKVR